jgi:transmembrane 9 superfamily protein 3
MEKKTICKLELNHETADAFKDAVANSYWFEFFVDDLPLWGMCIFNKDPGLNFRVCL